MDVVVYRHVTDLYVQNARIGQSRDGKQRQHGALSNQYNTIQYIIVENHAHSAIGSKCWYRSTALL